MDSPLTVDILFTVTVTTDPYATGLLLTNQASASESSTAGTTTATSAIKQIVLDEPLLTIDKAVTFSTNAGSTIDGNGNITDADAGDVLTFTVTSENTGDAPAHDVTFREPAVAGLVSCAVSSVTVGGVPILFPGGYSGDLFTTDLVLINPVPAGDTILVTYICTLASTVNPRDEIINEIFVDWAAGSGAPKFGEISDDAYITIGDPNIVKTLDAITPGPASPNVVPGDVITYRLTVTLPEGTTPGLIITDTLPAGFSYVNSTVSVDTTGFSGTVSTSPALTFTSPTLTLDFGDTTVTADNNSANNSFDITFDALVLDNAANSATSSLQNKTNNVSLNFTDNPGGAFTDSNTLSFGEPVISIAKQINPNSNLQAGDSLTITLTVTNSGTAPAYDVVVTDILNEGASNDLIDLSTVTDTTGAAVLADYTYNYTLATGTVTYSQDATVSLAAGANVVFTFTGTVRADVVLGSSSYSNTADVAGDSQDGVVTPPTGYPNSERPTSGTSPAVTVSMQNPSMSKTIAATSEAWTTNPNVAIGEVVTYQLAYTLYQGVTRTQATAAIFTDILPAGQQYLTGTATIQGIYDTGINGSLYGALPAVATAVAPTVTGAPATGETLGFNLGDMTNNDVDANTEQVIIRFNALVLNTSANNRTQTKTNTGRIYYQNRAGTNQSQQATRNVVINEPNLTVTKTPDVTTASGGDTITFTVVATNTSNTNITRAWELDLIDVLPTPEYGSPILVSAVLSRGSVDISGCGSFTGNTLNLDLTCLAAAERYLAPGENVTLVYTAVLDPNISFEAVTTNTVDVQTTSLPGTNGTGSATPGAPDSDTGERTGSNTLNTSGNAVNDLNDADNATVTANRPTIAKVVSDNTLQILETTTNTLTIPIPVGQTNNFVVTDNLPSGLSFTGTPITITYNGNTHTLDPLASPPAAGTDPLVFNFGSIQNSSASALNLVITYEVQVDNVIGNQNLTSLQNTASLSYTGVTLPVPSATATITVLEPNVTETKIITAGAAGSNAGDTVSYQTTISNTDPNGTAYQVNLRDVLPGHLLGANSETSPFFTNIILTNPGNAVVLNSDGVTSLTAGDATFDLTNVADDTLTWPLFDMPPNSSLTITYDVVVINDAIVGETLTNTISAVFDSRSDGTGRDNTDNPLFDGTGLNNYGVQTTRDLTLDASIAMQKTLAAGQPDDRFAIGEEVVFDLRVDVLTGITPTVVVTDDLPSSLEFLGLDTIDADTNISYAGAGTAVEAPVGTITVTMGDITNTPDANPANDYFIVRLRAKVQNIAANQNGVTLTDTGRVTSALNNASDTLDILVVEPNLAITKLADTTVPSLGGTVTYTVMVYHSPVINTPPGSSADAYDVSLTDLIPVGLTYVAGSFSGSGTVDDSGLPTLGVDLGSITIADISKSFSYQVTVDNAATVGSALTNTIDGVYASLPGANGDPDDGRNGEDGTGLLNDYVFTGTEDVTPSTPQFIRAPKTVAIVVDVGVAGQLDPGDTLEYTIVLENTGTATATNVTFSDTIPSNTTYVAASLLSTQGTTNDSGDPLLVDVGTMNAAATVTITFRVTVDAGTADGTIISNQGSIDSDQTVPRPTDDDDIDANGLEPTDIIVGPSVVIADPLYAEKRVQWLTDADASGSVTPGDTIRYTIVVDNLGSASLTSIQLDDTIPAGLTYVAASLVVTQEVAPNASIVGNTLSWPIGTLAGGNWAYAVFDVTIDSPLPLGVSSHTFTNQGTIDSDQTTPVPTDGNGIPADGYQPTSISAVDGIAASPALDVQKQWSIAVDLAGDGLASPDDTLEYMLVITNTGSAAATNVRLADTIPADTAVVAGSVVTSQGVVLGEDPVSINIGTVNPGQVITLSFRVLIDTGVADGTIISNQAQVSSNELADVPSDDNGNSTDGLNPTLTPVDTGSGSSLPSGLAKTLPATSETGSAGDEVLIGEVLTFEVSVNMPQGTLRQVTMSDTLPAGLTYIAGSTELAREFDTGLNAATNPGSINTAAAGTFVGLTDGTEMVVSGQNLSLFLGDIINSDSDVNDEQYHLRYQVVVANNSGNQAGVSPLNSAALSYQDALSQPFSLPPVGYTVTVIEPDVQISKSNNPSIIPSDGGTISFTVNVTNPTAGNIAPAYDVQITDILIAGYINLVVGVITPGGGIVAGDITDNSTPAGLDIIVSTFPVDGTLTIIYTAEAEAAADVPMLTNTAVVEWTSVPGTQGTSNATPGAPGTATGERNADAATDPVNDYTASDSSDATYKLSRRAISFEDPFCVPTCIDCTPIPCPAAGPHYIAVPDAPTLDLTTQGSIEAWIKPSSFDADAGIVIKGTTSLSYGFGLAGGTLFPGGTAGNICFRVGATTLVADSFTLIPGKWHHVACLWDNTGMQIYIDGVLRTSNAVAAVAPANNEILMIGRQEITPAQYLGSVEEFRIWNTARSVAEIRDFMCRTVDVSTVPPPLAELICYLRCDESGGNGMIDACGNGNNGVITDAVRICSSAPIGDTSDHDYYDELNTYSLSLTSGADTFSVDDDGGTWDAANFSGVHLYRVDDIPEPANGPIGSRLFSSRGYWGVFVTGGDEPTYGVTYEYDAAGIGAETQLQLLFRGENCMPWKDAAATLNAGPPANLTQGDFSGTEFILGSLVDPRNAIDYDGSDDHVHIGDNASIDLSTQGTLEAWIYIDTFQDYAGIIHKGDLTTFTDEAYSLQFGGPILANNNNQLVFAVFDASGNDAIYSTTALNSSTWYHVAGVWDDSIGVNTMYLYINGVLDATNSPTRTARNTNGGVNIGTQLHGGATFYPLDGRIDEVRVWDDARTQADIRDTMCKKLVGAEVNLAGYWRFDNETDSTTCPDYSGNDNAGTMTNFADVRAARVCSAAPIGDYSAYNYTAGISTVTLNPTGDPFRATASGGTWAGSSGIHAYRLDEAPVYPPDLWDTPTYPVPPYGYTSPNGLTPPVNATPPPTNWSSVDYYRYFGVFVTDPATVNQPQYDVVYSYNNNPMTPAIDDSVLGLARRQAYCFGTWTDPSAALDTTANTLTISSDTQNGPPKQNPEYVMGGKDAPLAITLASFTATAEDGCVDIQWETATEIDTVGFYLWRSDRRLGDYTRIERFIASNAKVDTQGAVYAYRDCDVDIADSANTYYYMLQEITVDSTQEDNMHGPIGPVAENITAAQTGGKKSDSDKTCFISILLDF